MIYITKDQYKEVLEVENNPINDDYIQQVLAEVKIDELSQYNYR